MNMGINFGNITDPETLKLIFILLDIFIISGWIVAFLIGMAKGMRKSLRFFLAALPGFFLLLLLMDPICKLVLNINIGFVVRQVISIVGRYITISEEVTNQAANITSLKELIVMGVNSLLKSSTPLTANSETYRLIEALITSFVRIFIYYNGILFNFCVLFPIFRAIIRAIDKKIVGKDKVAGKPNIISRLIGGGVMAVAVFVFTGMWALPLSGMVTTACSLEPSITIVLNQYKETSKNKTPMSKTQEEKEGFYIFENINLGDSELTIIDKGLLFMNQINGGITKNILSFGSNLDVAVLNSMTKIHTKNGSINYVRAFNKEAKLVNKAIQNNLVEGYFNYESFVKNDLKEMIKGFEKSTALAVVAPAAVEILEIEVDLSLYGIDIDELHSINWKNEVKSVNSAFICILDFINEIDLDINEPLKILEKENLDELAANLGESLQSSELITKIGFGILNKYAQEALKENLKDQVEDLDLALEVLNLRNISGGDWKNDFRLIANTARALYTIGVFEALNDSESKVDLNLKEHPDEITRIITNIFKLSFISGKENKLIAFTIDITGVKKKLGDSDIDIDSICEGINWQDESTVFAAALNKILELDIDLTSEDLEKEFKKLLEVENEKVLEDVLENVFDSVLVARIIPIAIDELLKKENQEAWISDWVKEARAHPENVLPKAYEDEVQIICDVLDIISSINTSEEELTLENLAKNHRDELMQILEKVVCSKLINMKASVKYIEDAINEALELEKDEKITIAEETIPANTEEWKKEIEVIKFMMEKLEVITAENFEIRDNEQLLHDLINKIYESKMLSPIANKAFIAKVVPIVEDMVNGMLEEGCQIKINEEDVPNTKEEWNNEITTIFKILDDVDIVTADDFDYKKAENEEVVTRLVNTLYESKMLKPHVDVIMKSIVISKIEEAINNLLETTIVIDLANTPVGKEAWINEIECLYNIIDNAKIIDKDTDTTSEESRASTTLVLENVNASVLLKPHLNTILNKVFSNYGYTEDLTELDLTEVKKWRDEVDALFDLRTQYETFDSSISIADISGIKDILTAASKGVISSYVIGSVIIRELSATYGKDADVIINKYDFRSGKVLKENAYPVEALINFGNSIKRVNEELESSNLTDEAINGIAAAMEALSNDPRYDIVDDGIVMMIKYGSGKDKINITDESIKTVDYTGEAEKLKKALIYYKSGNHIDAINEVNDTTLAKEILASLIN